MKVVVLGQADHMKVVVQGQADHKKAVVHNHTEELPPSLSAELIAIQTETVGS
jgi:hypothetical protein